MSLLKHEEEEGKLVGIPIGDRGEQLLYQLFADDTSLFLKLMEGNFRAAVEVIASFECISGARLNLEKSTILQLDEEPQPDWFLST